MKLTKEEEERLNAAAEALLNNENTQLYLRVKEGEANYTLVEKLAEDYQKKKGKNEKD